MPSWDTDLVKAKPFVPSWEKEGEKPVTPKPIKESTFSEDLDSIMNRPTTLHKDVWERIKKEPAAVRRLYSISDKNLQRSNLGYKALEGKATDDDYKQMDNLKFMIDRESELITDDPIEGQAVGQILPSLVHFGIAGAAGGAKGAIVGGVGGSVLPGMGTLAGAGAMAPVGAATEVVKQAYKMEAGGAYLDMLDIGIDKDIAAPAARVYGGISSLLESVAFKQVKHIIPGGEKVAKNIMKTAIGKAISKLSSPTAKAVTRLGGTSLAESSTEATQQLVQNVMTELAASVNDEEFGTKLSAKDRDTAIRNLQQGVAETFAITLLGMGIIAVPGTSINLLIDTAAGRKAAQAAKEEAPDVPIVETIKKKAAVKQAKKIKESRMQKAARQHEERKLAEKKAQKPIEPLIDEHEERKLAAKKVTKPVDTSADEVGPEGRATTPAYPKKITKKLDETIATQEAGFREVPYKEPPQRAAIEKKMKEYQKKVKVEKAKPAPIEPLIPETPVAKPDLTVAPTTKPDEGKASPTLSDFVQKYGGNTENNPYVDMMLKEDMKGVNATEQTD